MKKLAKKSKRNNEAMNKQANSCNNCYNCGHGKAQNRKGGEFSDLKVPNNEQARQDCR